MRGLAWGMVLAASLAACIATEPPAPSRGVIVNGPPPAPLAERERPPATSPGSIWVAGYWHWSGMQYAWIPGHWEANAPPGSTWTAPRYVSTDGAYFYEPGAWKATAPQASPAHANALR